MCCTLYKHDDLLNRAMQAAFMIPKKFEYQPVRRDETELIQKPVMYTIFPLHFPDTL